MSALPTTVTVDSNIVDSKTEEVQDIIERMPINFGKIVSVIAAIIFLLILLFGWLVRYPDIVTGDVTVNAVHVPIKLVSLKAGKLKLATIYSHDSVMENQIIAHIESATDFESALAIKKLISGITLPLSHAAAVYEALPKEAALGELSIGYFAFLNAVKQLADYQTNQLYVKQERALQELLVQQNSVLEASHIKAGIGAQNQRLYDNFYHRDSILFSKKVLSAGDFDRTKINHIGAQDVYQNTLREIATSKEQIARTNSQLQEISIQKTEKEQQLNLELFTGYNALLDLLRNWEQQYVFTTPIAGKVQFLKFWENNQFVQSGEEVFTILPHQEKVLGQVTLPAQGAGKVAIGQEVIVKLEDYPYMEYGSITARVKSISLTTKAVQTEVGEIQHYLVVLDFPRELQTNYGATLDFKYEIKGTAEIITKDRRLIERFFDNLKYIAEK